MSKITYKWLLLVELAGKRTKTVAALHDQYGPVVQLSPDEISFNAIDVVDQIYGQNTDFPKAQWYKRMTRGGVFNETDISIHRHKRRMLNHVFAQSSVNDMEPTIRHEMRKLLDRIEERRQKEPIDMRHWLRMLAFDVSTMVFFGQAAGGLDSHQIPQYVKDLDNAFLIWDLRGRFPTMSWLFAKLPLKSVQFFFQSDDRIYEYGAKRFQQYIDKYGRTSQRKDLLTKLIRREPGQDDGLTDEQISGEIANLTFAATDTAALALLYLFWELAQMPELQQQLRDELSTVPMHNGIPEHKHLWNLPLLNAVINETLRKHSPVVMGLLREVPTGGREMEGYYIPAKVRNQPCHARCSADLSETTDCRLDAVLHCTSRFQGIPRTGSLQTISVARNKWWHRRDEEALHALYQGYSSMPGSVDGHFRDAHHYRHFHQELRPGNQQEDEDGGYGFCGLLFDDTQGRAYLVQPCFS